MKRRQFSQREARHLQQQVVRLENQSANQRNAWIQEWPGGIHLGSIAIDPTQFATVKTARRLGHAVVLTISSSETVELYAIRLTSDTR